MEEFNGGYSNRNKGKTDKDGDFQEEDVWGFVKEKDSSRVIIPRGNSSKSNKSMVQKSSSLSSPVNIPEWFKNTNNKKSRRVSTTIADHGSSSSSSSVVSADYYGNNVEVEEEEDDDNYGDGMVPPHEYIARRAARNQIASFSMMEGVGRTLKGRDLSKLRNAILTKTGFLE